MSLHHIRLKMVFSKFIVCPNMTLIHHKMRLQNKTALEKKSIRTVLVCLHLLCYIFALLCTEKESGLARRPVFFCACCKVLYNTKTVTAHL